MQTMVIDETLDGMVSAGRPAMPPGVERSPEAVGSKQLQQFVGGQFDRLVLCTQVT